MTLACGRGAWVVALLLAGEGLDLVTGVVGAANPGGVWKDFVSWTGSLPQQAASAGSAFLQSAGNRATEVSQVLAPKFEEAKSAAGEKLAQAKEAAAPHLEGAKKALAPHLEQAGQFVDTAHERLRDASEAGSAFVQQQHRDLGRHAEGFLNIARGLKRSRTNELPETLPQDAAERGGAPSTSEEGNGGASSSSAGAARGTATGQSIATDQSVAEQSAPDEPEARRQRTSYDVE
eukprot:g3118.t1